MIDTSFNVKTEYSDEADMLRKNRVQVSFFKCSPARINFDEGLVEAKNSAEMCIEKYEKTKNREYLLDAMNYLMFEFMYPSIEGTYFKATDSFESAGKDGTSYNELKKNKQR